MNKLAIHFCTVHEGVLLEPQKTRFGVRWGCPVVNCTVACWNGSTSTPADYDTRQARIEAHHSFDHLWQSGMFSRSKAYYVLAKHLGLSKRKTHIGRFDFEQCQRTIEFCKAHTGLRSEVSL